MSAYSKNYKFIFSSYERIDWLKTICSARSFRIEAGDCVSFSFPHMEKEKMRPEYIVSLACLVEYFNSNKVGILVDTSEEIGEYLFEYLNLPEYWKGGKNYVDAGSKNILNLWHFDPSGMEIHAKRISEYLKHTFFKRKDLSAVEMSLTEAYYNIQDHAQCQGNAFSMALFDSENEILNVAVCDFGIGIPTSVRTVRPDISDDKLALIKALEDDFTVGSKIHNAGKGLGNIRSSCTECDYLWIISNQAALVATGSQEKVYDIGFNFEGTLIFYSMSLSHFDDEEIEEVFNW